MKPALVLILVLAAATATAQIPKNVTKEFERIHPGARFVEWKVEWGLLEDLYKVTYTSWYRQTLLFNRDAEIVMSASELPPDYIPNEIVSFIRKKYPHAKYVVWDSFDKNNDRSFFAICNETMKLEFSNTFEYRGESSLSKQKKTNLLSFLTGTK